MKLEDHVTSRKISERLKKLGVPQKSFLAWRLYFPAPGTWKIITRMPLDSEFYSAFTVSELGEMLKDFSFIVRCTSDKWTITAKKSGKFKTSSELPVYFSGETEAETRAKLLVFLLEKKLIQTINI